MKKLSKKKMMVIGGIVVLIIVVVLVKLRNSGRAKGYWKYPDSARIYYSDKEGVVGFKGGNGEYALHRQNNGLPDDFSEVYVVEENYEDNNGFYLKNDTIVLI
tara:strand:+ start:7751 stop:8059 length:309 start_codon:yes stop_codon:yes gene_type:complete